MIKVGNRIDCANAILKTKQIQGKPRVYYRRRTYEKKGSFGIMSDISDHVTLVQ